MSRSIILLSLFAIMLAACGSQATTPQPQESYPSPAQPESIQQPEVQVDANDPGYPPPYPIETPITNSGAGYPEPGTGITTFRIVPGESEVVYEVGEVFLNQDNAFKLAVGVTRDVSGEILVDRENPQNSTIGIMTVDVSQFTSDNQRRDNAIRERFLQSAQYPQVSFSPQSIEGLPENYAPGEEIAFQVSGDLTIRDVTKPATFDVTMVGNGDTINGEAATTILMSDYGFGPISIAGILNTEDEVKIKFVFTARP